MIARRCAPPCVARRWRRCLPPGRTNARPVDWLAITVLLLCAVILRYALVALRTIRLRSDALLALNLPFWLGLPPSALIGSCAIFDWGSD